MPLHFAVIAKAGVCPEPVMTITPDDETYDYEFDALLEALHPQYFPDHVVLYGFAFNYDDSTTIEHECPEDQVSFYMTLNTP